MDARPTTRRLLIATLLFALACGFYRVIPAEPLSDWLVVASFAVGSLGAGVGVVFGRLGLGLVLAVVLFWLALFVPAFFAAR
ncbi:MAG: hypothetical protein U0836_28260 [Pirellulales bacterium]